MPDPLDDIFSAATQSRDLLLLDALNQRVEEAARFARAQEIPAVVQVEPAVQYTAGGGGLTQDNLGGCFDQPYIPAAIVRRESGGDPYVINGGGHAASPYESGGRSWGCFQFMPGTWDANCAGLGFDVAGQIECADRVSSGGTNLRPWSL